MSTRTSDRSARVADRATRARRRRDRPPHLPSGCVSRLAFDKIGAVYVWLAIIVVFSIWVPDTFPTLDTAKQILNTNAITGLAALAILIPLVGPRLRPVVRVHHDAERRRRRQARRRRHAARPGDADRACWSAWASA